MNRTRRGGIAIMMYIKGLFGHPIFYAHRDRLGFYHLAVYTEG
jgi:hypothetical protein